jgi:hypothetical protein
MMIVGCTTTSTMIQTFVIDCTIVLVLFVFCVSATGHSLFCFDEQHFLQVDEQHIVWDWVERCVAFQQKQHYNIVFIVDIVALHKQPKMKIINACIPQQLETDVVVRMFCFIDGCTTFHQVFNI